MFETTTQNIFPTSIPNHPSPSFTLTLSADHFLFVSTRCFFNLDPTKTKLPKASPVTTSPSIRPGMDSPKVSFPRPPQLGGNFYQRPKGGNPWALKLGICISTKLKLNREKQIQKPIVLKTLEVVEFFKPKTFPPPRIWLVR